MAGRNRSRNRPPTTRFRVTAEEPSKEGGVWKVPTTVLFSRGRPLENEAIHFFLDGVRQGPAVRTDANGRTQYVIEVPLGTRRASVEAQAVGQPWVARDTVVFPTTPPVKPHSFEVDLMGGAAGKYRIAGMVRTEEDFPVKGAGVRILNAEDGTIVRTLHTDDHGNFMLVKSVPDGEVLELEVWVRGLHAPNNPTLLHLIGSGRRSTDSDDPEGMKPKLDIAGSFRRGYERARKE